MEEIIDKIIDKAKVNGFNIREKHVNIGISQLDVHYDYMSIINDEDFWKALGILPTPVKAE